MKAEKISKMIEASKKYLANSKILCARDGRKRFGDAPIVIDARAMKAPLDRRDRAS